MRITEGGDDTLCLSKHSIDFGPPRPSAGEGLGVRGEYTAGASSQCFKIPIQRCGVDMRPRKRMDRRQFVQTTAGASASSLLISPVQSALSAKPRRDNPVVAENAKPGNLGLAASVHKF